MSLDPIQATAARIAAAIAAGEVGAREVAEAALARIEALDGRINAFTDVTAARALETAERVDAARARGEPLGPLAGVPYAVKNLVDVAGLPTRAGSRINRELAPAARDGMVVRRLEAAGAVLVGTLNMGEYAYDFTGENLHDGRCANPHAPGHMTGGSSSGSAAAVAAGFCPVSIGSDTNGSIRVPAAFCGLFGLKPTYGRVSRAGTFPFVTSLDHVGPLARSARDLALAYDAVAGPDPDDPVCDPRPAEPALPQLARGVADLRIAVADGYFGEGGEPDCFAALARVAEALEVTRRATLPEAARARAAAYVITATEGAALHLDRLRERGPDFEPAVRDRLIAGALIPQPWWARAQRFRRWFRAQAAALFEEVDILLAPATPCRAPRAGQTEMVFNGAAMPLRPNMGVFTQPLSFIGLPVAAVPVWLDDGLPLGVQVIAAPWREAAVLRVAHHLERLGVARAPVAALEG